MSRIKSNGIIGNRDYRTRWIPFDDKISLINASLLYEKQVYLNKITR
jgi:hypothetical protein